MKNLIRKFNQIIDELEKEKKNFYLFALFSRNKDSHPLWDIVVSAAWLNPSNIESYNLISSKLKTFFSSSELLNFARIVVVRPDAPIVKIINKTIKTTGTGFIKLSNITLLSQEVGFKIELGYVLRSSKLE
jgi:hypothetical protein